MRSCQHQRSAQQCFLLSVGVILGCLVYLDVAHGKPIEEPAYKDTEEILNEWDNDSSYYDESEEPPTPAVKSLPPIFVEFVPPTTLPPTTTTTTTTTTTRKPVYFPGTDIELGPLFEQVGKARRNEAPDPVDLPVPYIVWTKDPTGQEDNVNYWKEFYNTMYKVD